MDRPNRNENVVLVVEDNPDDALILTRAVRTFGIRRHYVAASAEDALKMLAERGCDVVLLDYKLPGMDGLRLLEYIRKFWPDIRVVIVSGLRDDRLASSAREAGATACLSKDELVSFTVIDSLATALPSKLAGRS